MPSHSYPVPAHVCLSKRQSYASINDQQFAWLQKCKHIEYANQIYHTAKVVLVSPAQTLGRPWGIQNLSAACIPSFCLEAQKSIHFCHSTQPKCSTGVSYFQSCAPNDAISSVVNAGQM